MSLKQSSQFSEAGGGAVGTSMISVRAHASCYGSCLQRRPPELLPQCPGTVYRIQVIALKMLGSDALKSGCSYILFQVLNHSFLYQRADFIRLPESLEYFQGRLTMVLEIGFSRYKSANKETYHLLSHNSHDILEIHPESSDVSMFLYVGCRQYLFPVPPVKQLKICYSNDLKVLSCYSSCVRFTANNDYASQFFPQNFKTQ